MENSDRSSSDSTIDAGLPLEATEGSISAIDSAPSVRFSMVAKTIGRLGAQVGFTVPGFRSPPRSGEIDRTLRKDGSGSIVAVRIKDRQFEAVVADMIEGVVVCNGLSAERSSELRNLLWRAAMQVGKDAAPEFRHRPTAVVHRLPVGDSVEAA
ncbi:MAG: hypothetical protein QF637_02690 [Acidimicrobiales bacterium]|jgi:hypothetical protein|nr:hypothetical protein [Acidimicrobiales bacterium]